MILNRTEADSVALTIVDALEDAGYEFEEAIPGLIQAIILMARVGKSEEQILDEAMNILAEYDEKLSNDTLLMDIQDVPITGTLYDNPEEEAEDDDELGTSDENQGA